MSRKRRQRTLDLTGLDTAPSQVVGAVRLVPLLRAEPIEGLRLYRVPVGAVTRVELDYRTDYTAYVPHAMVAELPDAPRASLGARLTAPGSPIDELFGVKVMRRLARKQGPGRLRFLPQHLGIDAYLSLGFRGPDVMYSEFSQRALSRGLSPRGEMFVRGADVKGLADALRVFEVHETQVGVLVFVADELAAAFVSPCTADYRRLHPTLLADYYGELILQYGVLYPSAPALWEPIDAQTIHSLDDLSRAIDARRARWSEFAALMASGLTDMTYRMESVQRLGRFELLRFTPTYELGEACHVGECIFDERGHLAHLSTVRLSAAQVRRGYLIANFIDCGWDIGRLAKRLNSSVSELAVRLRKSGLGAMLRNHV